MRFIGFCVAIAIAAAISVDIMRSLDCIGGEKLACELIHKRYAAPAQPIEEK